MKSMQSFTYSTIYRIPFFTIYKNKKASFQVDIIVGLHKKKICITICILLGFFKHTMLTIEIFLYSNKCIDIELNRY